MVRCGYVASEELIALSDSFTTCKGRASRVHALIQSYALLSSSHDVITVAPSAASDAQLEAFHSPEFVRFLTRGCGGGGLQAEQADAPPPPTEEELEEFGLEYDCPMQENLGRYCRLLGGAAVQSAEMLTSSKVDVVINWLGGWHHAQRDHAAGFCYINDCVLSVLKLREKLSRVLYIDLDVHHGDGVQDAFYCTDKVFTLSFHRLDPGFYPGTGHISEIGAYKGRNYCLNIPLKDGLRDEVFIPLATSIITQVLSAFHPEAIVCQCGADGLAGDPMLGFNLTPASHVSVTRTLLNSGLPLLLLGGGGYHRSNTARCWAEVTAAVCGGEQAIPADIPDHEYLDEYGPDYTLGVPPGLRPDANTDSYLSSVREQASTVLKQLQS